MFPGCFLIVVKFAEALQVGRIGEKPPVSTMRFYVVHDGGLGSASRIGTFPAERFSDQLVGAQPISPNWQVIPSVPCSACAAFMLWPVSIAPAVTSQGRASRVPAWAKRQLRHRDHLRIRKKPGPASARHRASCWPWLSKHWPCLSVNGMSFLQRRQWI